MKYIFPKNYNYKNKILGVIDYPTAIFNIIIFIIIFSLFSFIFKDLSIRIILIIIFYFPILLFSLVGFNNESILYIIYYIIKFLISPKLYLYK